MDSKDRRKDRLRIERLHDAKKARAVARAFFISGCRYSDGSVCKQLAKMQQALRCSTEEQFLLLGPEVVAVQRVVTIDTNATVKMGARTHNTGATL